jgi:hypothetical protein
MRAVYSHGRAGYCDIADVVRALWLLVALAACGDNLVPTRMLYIRGGSRTGGFVEDYNDDQLADIGDESQRVYNHGYGELAQLLYDDGFSIEGRDEGPADHNTKVDLSDLGDFDVVFFASNNATYSAEDAERLRRFVRGGGGALFASDANWGLYWDKAPSSDQTFLTQFGLIINQDGGGLTVLSGADFVEPAHPILNGVTAFDGEGVSPCTLTHDPTALGKATRLVAATAVVRRPTAPMGPVDQPTDDDGSLVVVEYGAGRVACHFDRNTFFNVNGAGTSLASQSNTVYAHRLFAWLAKKI